MPPLGIFRSYDIRGIVGKDLDEKIMQKIGLALGNYVHDDVVLAYDVRTHSPMLKEAFAHGFLSSGFSVEDCGLLTLGSGMYHAWRANKTFAYITASHLTKEWNGVKFFHGNGIGFLEHENFRVRDIFTGEIKPSGLGKQSEKSNFSIIDEYRKYLLSKVSMKRRLDVVLDCGNGCAGLLAPMLFQEAGFRVEAIYPELDGNFPNRLPDPIERELGELKSRVRGKDLGIGYDGDADRTALIDDKGDFMTPEETSYVILSELLKTEKGPVIVNVECTRAVDVIADKFGCSVIRVPVGHTFLMDGVNRNHASYGVESAGHYCIPKFVPFDDAVVVGLYVSEVLAKREQPLSELRKDVPKTHFERLNFFCPDDAKFSVLDSLKEVLKKSYDDVNTMDGVRVDLRNGWALIRVSNTAPLIRLTVEGDTESDKRELQKAFIEFLEDQLNERGLDLQPEHVN